MKKLVLACSLFTSSLAFADDLKEIKFLKSRILSQGVLGNEEKQVPVTFVISVNPPMAIIVRSNGTDTVRRVASGKLKSCRQKTEKEAADLQASAVQLQGILNQIQYGTTMATAFGQSVPVEISEQKKNLGNYVHFLNEAVGKVIYVCEIPTPQASKFEGTQAVQAHQPVAQPSDNPPENSGTPQTTM